MRIIGAFGLAVMAWSAFLGFAFATEQPWFTYAAIASQFGISVLFVGVLFLTAESDCHTGCHKPKRMRAKPLRLLRIPAQSVKSIIGAILNRQR